MLPTLLFTLLSPIAGEPVVARFEASLEAMPPASDQLGTAVATDGARVVAGAPLAGDGRVVCFRDTGSGWVQEETVVAPSGGASPWFGWALDLEGEWLFVGAPLADEAATDSGATYVFRDPEGDGGWQHVQTLPPPLSGDDFVGNAIAIDGEQVLVRGRRTSVVYLLDATSGTWLPETTLPFEPTLEIRASLALSGDTAVVGYDILGSAMTADAGRAFVFERRGGFWSMVQELVPPQPVIEGRFGDALLLHRGRLFVGESRGPIPQTAGRVHVYAHDGASWTLEQSFASSDPSVLPRFGRSLAGAGGWVLVGAPGTDGGAAYLFSPEAGAWTERARMTHPDAVANDAFGSSVALDLASKLAACGVPRLGADEGGVGVVRIEPAFVLYCPGDGSAAPCPCANEAGPRAGCRNSTGRGAALAAEGSNDAAADDLAFRASGLVPNQAALLFAATAEASAAPMGDGLLCSRGGITRFATVSASASGDAQWGGGLGALGGWGAGDERWFQAWYRDPAGPCGGGFGLTHGLSVAFAP